jgi:hypothetical protein
MDARHVIANALSERRQQLTDHASPLDNDGARLVLTRLAESGYVVIGPNADASLLLVLQDLKEECRTFVEKRATEDCIEAVREAFGVKP